MGEGRWDKEQTKERAIQEETPISRRILEINF